jgi:hypothetical protein
VRDPRRQRVEPERIPGCWALPPSPAGLYARLKEKDPELAEWFRGGIEDYSRPRTPDFQARIELWPLLEKTRADALLLYDLGRCIAFIEANPEEYLSFGPHAVPNSFAAAMARAQQEVAGVKPGSPQAEPFMEMLAMVSRRLYEAGRFSEVANGSRLLKKFLPPDSMEQMRAEYLEAEALRMTYKKESMEEGLRVLDDLRSRPLARQLAQGQRANLHLMRGYLCFHLGRYAEAKEDLSAAKALWPYPASAGLDKMLQTCERQGMSAPQRAGAVPAE